MKRCLHEQISRNTEAYIDDIIVKSSKVGNLIQDLSETFNNLQKFKIKLNPKKCTFEVPFGKLLGYIISARGIKTNPMKVKAILDMGPPRALRDAQKLTGCLASLSHFISRLGKRGLPLYKLLRKMLDWRWTLEAQKAFDGSKDFLTKPPHSGGSSRRRAPTSVRRSYHLGGQHGYSCREKGRRPHLEHPTTGILPQSNTSREQNSLPTHPKNTLWGVLGKEEAGSLLRRAPDYRGYLLSTRRDHQQSGHDRTDRQMGPRTYGVWYHICATHVHKIPGSGELCC